MAKFISREKLGKKARKELDRQKRTVWGFSPITKKIDSKKIYNRDRTARAWKDDFGMSVFLFRLLFACLVKEIFPVSSLPYAGLFARPGMECEEGRKEKGTPSKLY